jgi:hypothetical protein
LDVNRQSQGELALSLEACFALEPGRSSAVPPPDADFQRELWAEAQQLVQVPRELPAWPPALVRSARR